MNLAVVGSLALDRVDGGPPRIGGCPFYAARALRVLGTPAQPRHHRRVPPAMGSERGSEWTRQEVAWFLLRAFYRLDLVLARSQQRIPSVRRARADLQRAVAA